MKRLTTLLLATTLTLYASLFSEAMRAYKSGNFEEAKNLFETALEEDGAEQARFFLGMLYFRGHGVKKDLAKAETYLQTAAENGNARAQCYLAEILLSQNRELERAKTLLKDGMAAGASECKSVAAHYKLSL
jgi:TPR repeat protein